MKIGLPGTFFQTEISHTTFLLSGAAVAFAGETTGLATCTLASHLLKTGDYVTFSGTTGTGATVLNNSTWGPITKTSSGVYTFPCTIPSTVTAGGTIVQEKLYFFAAGTWVVLPGANGGVEYNPDNTWGKIAPTSTSGPDTSSWRDFIDASDTPSVMFQTDGYAFRFRDEGTTATSYFSQLT